jgi:hypothetical protein
MFGLSGRFSREASRLTKEAESDVLVEEMRRRIGSKNFVEEFAFFASAAVWKMQNKDLHNRTAVMALTKNLPNFIEACQETDSSTFGKNGIFWTDLLLSNRPSGFIFPVQWLPVEETPRSDETGTSFQGMVLADFGDARFRLVLKPMYAKKYFPKTLAEMGLEPASGSADTGQKESWDRGHFIRGTQKNFDRLMELAKEGAVDRIYFFLQKDEP